MLKAIFIFLIPAVFAFLGIFIINQSKTAEVVHISAAYGKGTGYEQVPEQYTVTASPNYKWRHGSGRTWKVIVGLILFAAGAVFVYKVDPDVKKGFIVLGILWITGFGLIFGKYVLNYNGPNSVFEKTISADQFEQNKGDLDKIFDL